MSYDRDTARTDDYFVTALQIFDCCGVERSGNLRVDALMEKFAPFVKTNKAEYSYLKSLLDPECDNPEIGVSKLADALQKYSESQKTKMDLDESFNLRTGLTPQDSDSGISSDGCQLLEELQCELKEKSHLIHQLRSQLDFTDRQHEEVVAALAAERDSLRAHLNMLREENMSLSHVRRDFEEACERQQEAELALAAARRDLDAQRRRARDLAASDHAEKVALQELLANSKAECHRMNEMYKARQAALLEQGEALRKGQAEQAARARDQERLLQQLLQEKVILEMELKELVNRSNQTQSRLDRSIDVSYTEDQMLTALDSLTADSRFAPENRLLGEESFMNALKEDHVGRSTNMSLFDEIRYSFCNMSKLNVTESMLCEKCTQDVAVGTQNDVSENLSYSSNIKDEYGIEILELNAVSAETQTCDFNTCVDSNKAHDSKYSVVTYSSETQTDDFAPCYYSNKVPHNSSKENGSTENCTSETQTVEFESNANCNNDDSPMCSECEKANFYANNLEKDVAVYRKSVSEMQLELLKYEDNLDMLQKLVDNGNERNKNLKTVISGLTSKIDLLEIACGRQRELIDSLSPDVCFAHCQTDFDQTSVATQAEVPCVECERRSTVAPPRGLRRYLWEPLKSLFQVFAVVCFLMAVSALYAVTSRAGRCPRGPPARWLHAAELLDLLLRVDYVSDVPM